MKLAIRQYNELINVIDEAPNLNYYKYWSIKGNHIKEWEELDEKSIVIKKE